MQEQRPGQKGNTRKSLTEISDKVTQLNCEQTTPYFFSSLAGNTRASESDFLNKNFYLSLRKKLPSCLFTIETDTGETQPGFRWIRYLMAKVKISHIIITLTKF